MDFIEEAFQEVGFGIPLLLIMNCVRSGKYKIVVNQEAYRELQP